MYNILIAVGLTLATFTAIAVGFNSMVAFVPALIVFVGVYLVLARRTTNLVQVELGAAMQHLQNQRIDQAVKAMREVQAKHGKWQVLLSGQIEAQIGTIDYMQKKWDVALPKLEAGKFRNWSALTCIGCIHWRKGNYDKAWEHFQKAANAAPKEVIIYLVWATLLERHGDREAALQALDKGMKSAEGTGPVKTLEQLRSTIANKKKIQTKRFPESWYQFFPEDLQAQYMMRGSRGKPQGMPGMPDPTGSPFQKSRKQGVRPR